MANVIVVAGVPGAGKSSVLKEVGIRLSETFRIVSFGTEMLDLCRKRKLAQNRDQMRNLSITIQKDVQRETAQHISRMLGNILLDTHLAIKTDFGYIPGFTEEMLNTLKPKAIILVDANEVEIRGRRKLDKTQRDRTIETPDEILEHKLINRSFAAIASSKADSLLQIIYNYTGEFEEAVSTVISCLHFVTNENKGRS